jgi:hypothetical protein
LALDNQAKQAGVGLAKLAASWLWLIKQSWLEEGWG